MKTKKVMKLIDPESGKMICTVCGKVQWTEMNANGKYNSDSWHCQQHCEQEFTDSLQVDLLSLFIEGPEESKDLPVSMPTLPCSYKLIPALNGGQLGHIEPFS